MKFTTKALSALALALAAVGVQAADVPAGTELNKDQTLKLMVGDSPKTLDPTAQEENIGYLITSQAYEALIAYDAKGDIIPAGAVSWTASEDGKTYTFQLRKEAKWSNGDPVTAQDYVTAWQRLVDPTQGFTYSFYLADLGVANAKQIVDGKAPVESLGVKALDDYTLEVSLEQPAPWFIAATKMINLVPIPTKLYKEGSWPKNRVSNGPYVLTEEHLNDNYVIVKNDNYWNKDKTVITKATIYVVKSSSDGFKRLEAGDLDASRLDTSNLIKLAKAKEGQVELVSAPAPRSTYYSFNLTRAPFNDIRVREALSIAIDGKFVIGKVLPGVAEATSVYTSYAIPGATAIPQEAWISENINTRRERAKKLLAEAGYSESKPLEFIISYNTAESHKLVSLAIQGQLKQAFGNVVKTSLQNSEWTTFLADRQAGKFDFYRSGWGADYYEPSTFYGIWKSDSTINDGGYKNPEYDKLFDSIAGLKTEAERMAAYTQLNHLLTKDWVTALQYNSNTNYAVNPKLKGLNPDDNKFAVFHMYKVK